MNPDEFPLPSNRRFGYFFAVIFTSVTLYFVWVVNYPFAVAFGSVSLLIFLTASLAPERLKLFNLTWMKFGHLLAKIVNPIVLGVIFFLVLTPIALVIKLTGRDELSLKNNDDGNTYWKSRDPNLHSNSFEQQF